MKRVWTKVVAVLLTAGLLTTCVSAASTAVSTDTALREPRDVLVTENGLYAVDAGASVVWRMNGGKTTVAAGYTDTKRDAYPGYLDGPAEAALFNEPSALAEWMGGIVVSDTENHVLRLVKDGKVRTLAGTGKAGDRNGGATQAMFNGPRGLAVDSEGALLIADCWNGMIRKLAADGRVTTYARGLGEPAALAWYDGTLYVADAGKNQILSIKNGRTTVLAGTGEDGLQDGVAARAQFSYPMGIAADSTGVYVSDTGNNVIRKISDGKVATLLGNPDSQELWPVAPMGMQISKGILYVADAFAGVVLQVPLASPFDDVAAGHPDYDGIVWAANQGVAKGITATGFGPGYPCTRGQAVTFLWRAAGSPEPMTEQNPFTDVKESSAFYQAILWAVENGIVGGYGDGTFRPQLAVSRAQMMSFLWRYAGKPAAAADAGRFTDVAEDYVHGDAIRWAVGTGIAQGAGETVFGATMPCTRGQTMTYLYRIQTQ